MKETENRKYGTSSFPTKFDADAYPSTGTSSSKPLFPLIPKVKLEDALYSSVFSARSSNGGLFLRPTSSQVMEWTFILRLTMKESTFAILRWNDYRVCVYNLCLKFFFPEILTLFVFWYRKRLSAEKWKLLWVDKLWLYVERCWRQLTRSNGNQDSLMESHNGLILLPDWTRGQHGYL